MSAAGANAIQALGWFSAIACFLCFWIIPQSVQDDIDYSILWLSESVKNLSFANFGLIDRDVTFEFLHTIFRSRPWSISFLLRVVIVTIFFSIIFLCVYLVIPLSDPLSIQLVGVRWFFTVGVIQPNIVISALSTILTLILIQLGGILKTIYFYIIFMVLDIVASVIFFSSSTLYFNYVRSYAGQVLENQVLQKSDSINLWTPSPLGIVYILINIVYHPYLVFEAVTSVVDTEP